MTAPRADQRQTSVRPRGLGMTARVNHTGRCHV